MKGEGGRGGRERWHLEAIEAVPYLSNLLPFGADHLAVEAVLDDEILGPLVLLQPGHAHPQTTPTRHRLPLPLTILAAISRRMLWAAATPLGSPSIRMTSLFSSSGGILMDVPVSVLILFTGGGEGVWSPSRHS